MANIKDLSIKISANPAQFISGMRTVQQVTTETAVIGKKASEQQQATETVTLKMLQERANAEKQLGREGVRTFDATRTAAEKYQDKLKSLNAQLAAGKISQDTFNRATSQANDELKKASGNGGPIDHFKNQIRSMLNPTNLMIAALAALGLGAKAAYKDFKELEVHTKSVNLTLENLGVKGRDSIKMFKELRETSGLALTEIAESYDILLQASGDLTQSEEDLNLVMEGALKTGKDAKDVATAISDARKGSISGLRTVNLLTAEEARKLEEVKDSGDRAAIALALVKERVEGTAAAQTEAQKNMNEARAAWEDFTQVVGGTLSGLVDAALYVSNISGALDILGKSATGWRLAFARLTGGDDSFMFDPDNAIQLGDGLEKVNEEMNQTLVKTEAQLKLEEKLAEQDKESERLRKEIADAKDKAEEQQRLAAYRAYLDRVAQTEHELALLKEQDPLRQQDLKYRHEVNQLMVTLTGEKELNAALDLAALKNQNAMLKLREDLAKSVAARVAATAKRQADETDEIFTAIEAAQGKVAKALQLPADVMSFYKSTVEALITPQEKFNKQLEMMNQLAQYGFLSDDQYAKGLANYKNQLEEALRAQREATEEFQVMAQIGDTVAGSLITSFQDLLFDPMNASFLDMAANFADAVGRMALEVLVLQGLKSAAGALSGGQADTIMGALMLASGGPVRGPGTSTSDSIPAYLSNGEYVVKAKAVSHYGQGVFDSFNNMNIPRSRRYADGGLVTSMPQGGISSQASNVNNQITIANIMPEDTASFLTSRDGGELFINLLEKNKTLIKNF